MALVPTTNPSGSYSFWPSYADIVLEGFDRAGVRAPGLTQAQLVSAYRSINLALSTWPNRTGKNLWAVDLQTVPLIAGQLSYNLPTNTIQLLDVYLRLYPMGASENITVGFATTSGDDEVTITWPAHGLIVGNYVNITVPVSVGGLVLLGFYTVTSVPSGNAIIITASANASSTDSPGVVPQFTTVAGSDTVTVTFPNHGQTAGSTFNVQVLTTISDVQLQGSYIVQSVANANHFTITAANAAYTSTSTFENSALALVAGQNNASDPIDRILYPISETDYAALPDKYQQGTPTSFWYNRQSPTPQIFVWQVLQDNITGPWALMYYRTRQLQDANIASGQTPDVPYRFFEALCADVASRLAQKFAPDKWMALRADAAAQWEEAANADTEKVSLYIAPDVSDYYT